MKNLAPDTTVLKVNVALERIPFDESTFDSVSAYDFLEHVPRVLPTLDGNLQRFPFIELMNEVWRVLKPHGLFYASTPCYPHPAIFQDPTHVNPITMETHQYFTRPRRFGQMYGFTGDFEMVRVLRVQPRDEYSPVRFGIREWLRRANHRRRGTDSHVIWEFRALKPQAAPSS